MSIPSAIRHFLDNNIIHSMYAPAPGGSLTEHVIGASLSEPHTSVTALLDACVCMFVRDHIPKI